MSVVAANTSVKNGWSIQMSIMSIMVRFRPSPHAFTVNIATFNINSCIFSNLAPKSDSIFLRFVTDELKRQKREHASITRI